MEPIRKLDYKWDNDLIYSDENFGTQLHQDEYDPIEACKTPFPSDYILALFSKVAYPNNDSYIPKGWLILTSAQNNKMKNGYYGVAFWNPKLCQVVVAHRGTTGNVGAVIADIKLACNNYKSPQSQSAATFVHKVKQQITQERFVKGPRFHLSITGHSLGAWLAQITTYTVKYLEKDEESTMFVEDKRYQESIHPHTVVFESPGCREALKKITDILNPYLYLQRKFGDYDILDMTVYLSKLNFINVINEHVGIIYMIKCNTHWLNDILALFDITTHHIDKEIILHFRSGIGSSGKWFLEKVIPYNFKKSLVKRTHDNNIRSLNIFNEEELDFVKDWISCCHLSLKCLREFRDKHKFTLNYDDVNFEYHMIKNVDLNRIIASIKLLRPTKAMMVDLLRNDIPDLVDLINRMLEFETQHYKETLLKFDDCYFRDKYGLNEFLETNDSILHVKINDECAKSEFECGILHNILQSHKTRSKPYYFLKWKKLNTILQLFPDVIGQFNNDRTEELLIIIDCLEINEEESKTIEGFLKNKSKVILISSERFSWKQDCLNIKEVMGYEGNITFEDLTEEKQEQFINQKNLDVYGREMSLKDITNVSLPLTDEILLRLNKVIPFEVLLGLLLTPTGDPVKMGCPYSDSLAPFTVSDLNYEVNLDQHLNQNSENELFLVQDPTDYLKMERNNFVIGREIDFEKQCFANLDKTVYFFIIENCRIYLNKIYNEKFYITRYITPKNIVSPRIFTSINETPDQFFFTGDKERFQDLNQSSEREFFKFISSDSNIDSRTKENQHFLHVEAESLTWKKSHNSIETLYNFMEPQKQSVSEREIIKHEKLVIINGGAGSGKSSTVTSLYLHLQKTHWVFLIKLKRAAFQEIATHINWDSAAKFIVESTSIYNKDCVHQILSYCLKYNTNLPIHLLFDDYDEISHKNCRKNFTNLINFLVQKSTAKVLITTRTFCCRKLESELCIFSSPYRKIDQKKEMVAFFKNFWFSKAKLLGEPVDSNKLAVFAANMLEIAKNTLGQDVYNLISLPLHMRMIAKVVTPNSSMTLINILDLYEKYVQSHYDIHFNKKELNDPMVIKWLSEVVSQKFYTLAMAKVQGNKIIEMNYDDMSELNRLGLIHSEPDDIYNYEFHHDSVRNYFVAGLLVRWLSCRWEMHYTGCDIPDFIIRKTLINPKFNYIRLFLNLMLKNCTTSPQQLEVCRNKFKEMYHGNKQNKFYNDQQECTYHVCVKENLPFLIKSFLHEIIVDENVKVKFMGKRDSSATTPLYLAITTLEGDDQKIMIEAFLSELNEWSADNIKAALLLSLFTHLTNEHHLATLLKYTEKFKNVHEQMQQVQRDFMYLNEYLEACKYNNVKKVRKILQNLQNDPITKHYLLLATNERMESGLHLTSSAEITETLLQNGTDKDARDHHGMTPLNRALKANKIDLAKILILNNAIDVKDFLGNSSLMHAIKYDHFDLVKLLLDPKKPGTKCDVNQSNSYRITPLMVAAKTSTANTENIVRYLLLRGARVNDKDCNGMNAFFHAVRGENRNLMRLLRQNNADINVQDNNGVTPFMYSVMKRSWSTVQSLLDHGVDVSIGNNSGLYPLHLLIDMKQTKIIKRILIDETTKSGIVRGAANLDILNKDQILFIKNL